MLPKTSQIQILQRELFQEGLSWAVPRLEQNLHERGAMVLACDHSDLAFLGHFLDLNQTPYDISSQKIFWKVTCWLFYEQRCRVPAEFLGGTANMGSLQNLQTRPGRKTAGRLMVAVICKTPYDLAAQHEQEQSAYLKCFNIKTNTF